jgi:hypothetical protein
MGSDVAGKEFQRYGPAEFAVLHPVHLTHASRTDFANDAIVSERSTGGKFCHFCSLYVTARVGARRNDDTLSEAEIEYNFDLPLPN